MSTSLGRAERKAPAHNDTDYSRPVYKGELRASVIGGFGTPIGLVILVLLARDHTVMGTQPISGRLAIGGWTVAAVVGGFGLLYVIGAALGKF